MTIRRKAFADAIKVSVFGGRLKQSQWDGMSKILDEWERRRLTDVRWLANILAQAYHETAHTMQPVREYGGEAYLRSKRYYPWVGEGLIQVTWEANHRKFGATKPGQLLTWPIALRALFDGMIKGMFTGKKLADYFNNTKDDPKNARRIVNGVDKAALIAGLHRKFLDALTTATDEIQPVAAFSESDTQDDREAVIEDDEADEVIPDRPEPPPPAGEGSLDIEVVQRRLSAMGYTPGGFDGGKDGMSMTVGAIASFKSDRHLPGSPVIDETLKAAIAQAEAEGFKRPISAERATATEADLAPKVQAVREAGRSRLATFWLAITTGVSTFFGWIVDQFETLQNSPIVQKIVGMIGTVPWYVWAAGLVGVLGFIWQSQNKIASSSTTAFNEGRLTAGEQPAAETK